MDQERDLGTGEPASRRSPSSGRGGAQSDQRGTPRLLLIDDSPSVCWALRDALAPSGYRIEWLASFVDLPRFIRDTPPDLIFLDLNIPALSGIAMGRYVRKHHGDLIPILIYSSCAQAEMLEAAREIRASGVVAKGAPPAELLDHVKRALSRPRR